MLAGLLTHAGRKAIIVTIALSVMWAATAAWDMQRFRNDRVLWNAALRVDPANFVANSALAEMDYKDGNVLGALNHARIAILRNAPRIEMLAIAIDCMERLRLDRHPDYHREYLGYVESYERWRRIDDEWRE
jgi:hypothetical protein